MSRKPENETAKKQHEEKTAREPRSNVVSFPGIRSVTPPPDRMNMREVCSVKAMTAYVADNQNVREETVLAFLTTAFKVPDIDQLRRDDYERVIAYLVDLRCDLLLN